MSLNSDVKLVKRLNKGDEKAFSEFFFEYYPRLFRFSCARLQGDKTLAEEATQNALSSAVQKISTFRGDSILFTWLCTFCRHEVYAIIKRESKLSGAVSFCELSLDTEARYLLQEEREQDPFKECQRDQIAHIVNKTKNKLPNAYGEVLERKYINGESVKDIAQKIGRNPKATESLLSRARAAFKQAFIIASNDDQLKY